MTKVRETLQGKLTDRESKSFTEEELKKDLRPKAK